MYAITLRLLIEPGLVADIAAVLATAYTHWLGVESIKGSGIIEEQQRLTAIDDI